MNLSIETNWFGQGWCPLVRHDTIRTRRVVHIQTFDDTIVTALGLTSRRADGASNGEDLSLHGLMPVWVGRETTSSLVMTFLMRPASQSPTPLIM